MAQNTQITEYLIRIDRSGSGPLVTVATSTGEHFYPAALTDVPEAPEVEALIEGLIALEGIIRKRETQE